MNDALGNELARALRNHHYEPADDGRLLLPRQRIYIGGSFLSDVNGADRRVTPNLYVAEGRTDLLSVYFKQTSGPTGYYIAPFAGNVDPDDTLTAANFAARQTEFTAYNEATRVTWTPGAISTPQVDNSGALATFTITSDGATVWGFALLTAQTKSATTGKLIACTKDATARDNLRAGDKLNVQYAIVATDAG